MNRQVRLRYLCLYLGTSFILQPLFAQDTLSPGMPLSRLYWLADDWTSHDGRYQYAFSVSGDSIVLGTAVNDQHEHILPDTMVFSFESLRIQSTAGLNIHLGDYQLSAATETEWHYKQGNREFHLSRIGLDTLRITQLPDVEQKITLVRTPRIQRFEMSGDTAPVVMRKFWHLTYFSGSNRSHPKEEAMQIQAGHLEHLSVLAKTGKACVAGPTDGIGEVRGFIIFTTATMEEAVFLANMDPAVKAGRLSYRIDPWWAMEGAVLK